MLPVLSYIQHYKKYYTAQFEAASAAYGLNQLEIDILLFLHNNPECHTAGDICRYRGLLGFTADGQRIATALAEIQHRTVEPLFEGFTAEEQQRLQEYLSRMDANIQRQLKKE